MYQMASVVKWLRPRIVVPLCVGSNPTTRPTKEQVTFVTCSLVLVLREDENPQQAEPVWVRADFFAECGVLLPSDVNHEGKTRRHV